MFIEAEKKKSTNNLTFNLRCPATSVGPLGNGASPGIFTPDQAPRSSVHRKSMLTMEEALKHSATRFVAGEIVKGRVIEVRNKEALVDIGYKSEGVIPGNEFDDIKVVKVGDEVDVLIEKLE